MRRRVYIYVYTCSARVPRGCAMHNKQLYHSYRNIKKRKTEIESIPNSQKRAHHAVPVKYGRVYYVGVTVMLLL